MSYVKIIIASSSVKIIIASSSVKIITYHVIRIIQIMYIICTTR